MKDMETKLIVRKDGLPTHKELPIAGLSAADIDLLLKEHAKLDEADVAGGKVSGTVYSMDPRLRELMIRAFSCFFYSNPLHPDVFPSVRKMEAELVAMTLSMFNGDEECGGVVTSGGTESILLACKAYRDRARHEKGILFPEVVAPVTAHAAFEKAAHYFGIRLVGVAIDPETGKVNLKEMRRMINGNTIALVGSAPNFALGVIDDIVAIAALAKEFNIGCHVDCCLGSFILPHMIMLKDLSPVDFAVPGVTSISCDPHKYGFGPKGTSIIMYRGHELRQYQYFVSTEWTGGIYATPTLLGSRSGAIIAATWVAILSMGQHGYHEAAQKIKEAVEGIVAGIRTIDGLFVIGEPSTSVVAFGSRSLNIYAINDVMNRFGWHLNALQNPPAVHIACTMLTSERTVATFITDLKMAVAEVKSQPLLNLGSGTAAIYGTNAALPDKTIVEDVAKGYLDLLYKL